MIASALSGRTVLVATRDDAASMCAGHLERLGARIVEDGLDEPDVVLADDRPQPERAIPSAGMLTCVFESHLLQRGGLIGSETTAQAAAALTDYIAGAHERPSRTGCDIATTVTGFFASQAILAWLYGGRVPGAGHVVRVSTLRSLATLKTILWAARSRPDSWSGTHVRSRDRLVDSGYVTADRRITLDFPLTGADGWLGFATELGLDPELIDRLRPSWAESIGWGDDVDAYRPAEWAHLAELSAVDAIDLIRRQAARRSCSSRRRHASGIRRPERSGRRYAGHGPSLAPRCPGGAQGRSFRALTRSSRWPAPGVVDLGRWGVGPFSATLSGLAWRRRGQGRGAERVHPRGQAHGRRAQHHLPGHEPGQRSVSLDLKQEEELELALALVDDADVVIENFRPGALARLGLGFDDLSRRNPGARLLLGVGLRVGRAYAGEPCTDPHMQAFSGFAVANADSAAPAAHPVLRLRRSRHLGGHRRGGLCGASRDARARGRLGADRDLDAARSDGGPRSAPGGCGFPRRRVRNRRWIPRRHMSIRRRVGRPPRSPAGRSAARERAVSRARRSPAQSRGNARRPRQGIGAGAVGRLGASLCRPRHSLLACPPRRRGARPQGVLGSRSPASPADPGSRGPRRRRSSVVAGRSPAGDLPLPRRRRYRACTRSAPATFWRAR